MASRDGRSSRRPRSSSGTGPAVGRADRGRTWLLVLLVAVLLVGTVVYRYDVVGRVDEALGGSRDPGAAGAPGDPAAVAPPTGVDLPALRAPSPVAAALPLTTAATLDPGAVRRALRPLGARVLGPHVRAVVAPLGGGPATLTLGGSGPATPASTTKLVTTSAALLAMGPDHRFTTSVVGPTGHGRRRIVLVGGGDPYLERGPGDAATLAVPAGADVTTLARRAARTLLARGVRRVSLGYDDSLFTGPDVSPDWEPDYVPDGVVAPIQALWVDQGRPETGLGRVSDPALDAARAFAAALARAGVTLTGDPTAQRASPGSPTLASMASAPLSQIVEHVLEVSDNEGAEVLLRQTGVAHGGQGSFVGGALARAALLRARGIKLTGGPGGGPGGGNVLHDGSGLARDDALDPAVLVAVLRLAASPAEPDLRAVLTGLPVAGFSGSLAARMDDGPRAGLGRVRAKTGTLTGVTALAGVAVDLDGIAMVFVLMADRVKEQAALLARVAMDDAAADLGACHCSR